jgi:hypothetical protein
MAPEQAVGEPSDHRTDLYALGVVLWETIVGQSLWEDKEITTLFTRQLSDAAPSMKQASGDRTVPDALDRLVQSMLERSPKDRPASAALVRDRLREFSRPLSPISTPLHAMIDELAFRAWSLRNTVLDWISRWRKQRFAQKRAQLIGAAVGFAILFVVILGVTGGEERETKVKKTEAPQSATLLDKTVETLAQGAQAVREVVTTEPEIPPDLEETVETMKSSKRMRDRRRAARKVLAYEPASALSLYVKNIATLEAARGCRERKKAIQTIEKAGDKRTLPSLRYLSRRPKTGCGFLGLEDCYSCIRADLREAIYAIEDKTD